MADGFIAYQDEEHGLGYKAAQLLADKYARNEVRRPRGDVADLKANQTPLKVSPRRDTASTLAALVSHRAAYALVPLEDDRGKFDKLTLEALIDFKDYYIEAELSDDDDYVLAVPSVSVYELGESAFPSSFGNAASVGALPRNLETQSALRRRVSMIYATADALERCQAALHGYEAQGITIHRLAENEDPYRTVLKKALADLDPERTIYTSHNDGMGGNQRISELRAANHAKPLIGVLLPRDVATLGRTTAGNGLADPSSAEYVLLDDHLEGSTKMSSRFLVLSRIPEKTSDAKQVIGGWGQVARLFEPAAQGVHKVDKAFNRFLLGHPKPEFDFARFLVKLDTRGQNVKDMDEFTNDLIHAKLKFTPIVLNKRPDRLPVVFEVEVPNEERAREKFKSILGKAEQPGRNWNTRLLGGFGTDTSMQGDVPIASHRPSPISFWQGVMAAGLVCAAVLWFIMANPLA